MEVVVILYAKTISISDSSDYQTIFEEKDIGLKEFKPTENIWTIGKSVSIV